MDRIMNSALPLYTGGTVLAVSIWYALRYIMRASKKGSVQKKVVLITGASSGLGEGVNHPTHVHTMAYNGKGSCILSKCLVYLAACAHAFYRAGAKVILCARRHHELARVKEELMSLPKIKGAHEPMIMELDLADFNRMALRIEEAMNIHGHIDILINNGGMSYRGEVEMTALDVDLQVMNVNYFGQVALTKALLPFMIGRKSGHIVAISSIQGKLAIPFRSSYTASKHAMQAFFDCLRAEVGCYNIHVSVVSPGYIKTNLSVNAVTGDGSSYGVNDATQASGMKPESVASRILEAVLYKNREVIVAPLVHQLAVILRTACPGLFFWLMSSRANKERKGLAKDT